MDLQERITHGWEISAEGFSKKIVAEEFENPGRGIWTDLILEKALRKGKLDILDVGTGPGVFATILAMAGHRTTGIDISANMLEQAEMNSKRMGVSPKYMLMNSQKLDFADNSFDIIVSRMVVWTIKEPEAAYLEWLRCLKPGGRVLVFDHAHKAGEFGINDRAVRNDRNQEYYEKFGEMPPLSYENYEEARGFKRELKLTHEERPQWDIGMMKRLGYTNICLEDVTERTCYTEKKKVLNTGSQLFRLCGDKAYE